MARSADQLAAIKAALADAMNESYMPAATAKVIDAVPTLLAEVERLNGAVQLLGRELQRDSMKIVDELKQRAASEPRLSIEDVERFLKRERDEYEPRGECWNTVDDVLDALRLHMVTGTPLTEPRPCDGPEAPGVGPEPLTEAEELRAEVERLRAELEHRDQAVAEALADQTLMKGLTVKDGAINLDLIPPREIAALWVHCARGMLGDAENYSETRVDMPSASMEVSLAGEFERFALIVQRVGRLTPHEARKRAEAERDELRTLLERLTDSVKHDLDSSACRKRAAHQQQLSPCQQRPADHDEECPLCEALAVLHPEAVPGA
ncbi:hypothetical protein [Streptosporangium roseum]|uniref:hypothetical protein n=1 Tax=Streptosporangium roseum TaxID=2001 RepID=UPI0004CD1ED0|nr:hypothetical protein [Streptosporangium roseum]